MGFFTLIKRKFFDILREQNKIDNHIKILPNSYISGSTLQGNIILKENVKIYQTHIEGNIEIGRFSSIWGPNTFLIGRKYKIQIGSFCSIAKNVSIQEDNHNIERLSTYFFERNLFNENLKPNAITSKGEIIIGNDVWIGSNSVILSGVKIGNGAVIAAGSIVTKDVPSYSIVGGNPAKILKYRFEEDIIIELEKLKWWDWTVEKLKKNRELFYSNFNKSLLKGIND